MKNPQTSREWLEYAVERVKGGHAIKRWSPDTISVGGRCAQLVRETSEGALDLPANTWPVAVLAHKYRKARGGADRWAADYEQAARELGLSKDLVDVRIGDILYWPYTGYITVNKRRIPQAYGHTAMYAGLLGGEPHVLENSDWAPARRKEQGAILPLGDQAHVYLTPLRLFEAPTTVITPTRAIQQEEARVIVARPAPVGRPSTPAGSLPPGWYPTVLPDGRKPTGRYVSIQIGPSGPVVFEVPEEKLRKAGLR